MTKPETPTTPKGISEEHYNLAKKIIESGFAANQDENAIKSAMFEKGILFSDLVRLYKNLTIELGLIRSSKEINEEIDEMLPELLEEMDLVDDSLTYDDFMPAIDQVCEEVDGANEKRVVGRIRAYLADQDLSMPKKPKARKGDGGGERAPGKVNKAIADYFKDNDEPTLEGFKVAMNAVTTEKSTKKWCRMFKTFEAISSNKSLV